VSETYSTHEKYDGKVSSMNSKNAILKHQLAWARSRGLLPDSRGYVSTIDDNLRKPLSAAARAGFERGGGSELSERNGDRAKMCALHSSAALAVNVFDHWVSAGPVLQALGLDGVLKGALRFEAQFPTGLRGTPPNLDVAFELDSGVLVGIESKFTEWLTPKRSHGSALAKYFHSGARHWEAFGLAASQALAADVTDGAQSFLFLDAPQLLKHALGLARNRPNFCLYYVYFDLQNEDGQLHRGEIDTFAARVGAELRFRSMSYQTLYRALCTIEGVDTDYLSYLHQRYFDDVTRSP